MNDTIKTVDYSMSARRRRLLMPLLTTLVRLQGSLTQYVMRGYEERIDRAYDRMKDIRERQHATEMAMVEPLATTAIEYVAEVPGTPTKSSFYSWCIRSALLPSPTTMYKLRLRWLWLQTAPLTYFAWGLRKLSTRITGVVDRKIETDLPKIFEKYPGPSGDAGADTVDWDWLAGGDGVTDIAAEIRNPGDCFARTV